MNRLHRFRSPARRALACVFLLASFGTAGPAYGDWPSGSKIFGVAAAGLLAPSQIGALTRRGGADFTLGWSWQVPFTVFALLARDDAHRGEAPSDWLKRHRVVGALGLLPVASGGHVRGRIGYRFSVRYFFAGAGGTFASPGNTWSPELGARFLHWRRHAQDDAWDPALHLLVRPEIAPGFDEVRAVTVLLGWTFI